MLIALVLYNCSEVQLQNGKGVKELWLIDTYNYIEDIPFIYMTNESVKEWNPFVQYYHSVLKLF